MQHNMIKELPAEATFT